MSSRSRQRLRTVVIGLGVQGRKRRRVAQGDVVATVDPHNTDADVRTLAEVPPEDFDAAMVCTPDDAKPVLVADLLERGKHVLVEKPLLADTATLRDFKRLAKENGAVCYTAYNHRFEPHIVRLKKAAENGALGRLYLARFFYGNGTARDVRDSPWRDKDGGVLGDLGSHLLDLALFLFGPVEAPFLLFSSNRFENKALDHVSFGTPATADDTPVLEMEATLVSWRNSFGADLYGEKGSAHVESLCKWGPSRFILRTRVLPSGPPAEDIIELEEPDPTWETEYRHFKSLCAAGSGDGLDKDIWIAATLDALRDQVAGDPGP